MVLWAFEQGNIASRSVFPCKALTIRLPIFLAKQEIQDYLAVDSERIYSLQWKMAPLILAAKL